MESGTAEDALGLTGFTRDCGHVRVTSTTFG